MSASQMRYCMISGRKSDVEFQGQQINQQRTTLATETSAYNNQLMDLVVPTPPSTADYTKTSYTFSSNGETRTVAGTVYDSSTGNYTVNYTTQTTTSQGKSSGTSVFGLSGSNYTTSTGTVLAAVETNPASPDYSSTDISNVALIMKNCGIANNTTYTIGSGASKVTLSGIQTDPTANGYNAADVTALQTIYGAAYKSNESYYKYNTGAGTPADPTVAHYVAKSAISGTGTTPTFHLNATGTAGVADTPQTIAGTTSAPNFYKYTSGGNTKYMLADDLQERAGTTAAVSTYYVDPSATVTESAKLTGATVNWNDSGRMTSITDANGKEYALNVTTTDDSNAYADAYNEYEYKKSQYDQKLNSINAQVSVIQSQDKRLELKLQDLDTQQQALNTEMDSVKKVVDKNIETSFKAFA